MKNFTDAEFKKDVLDSDVPVLVDFWAPWCGPCQIMLPIFEELDHELQGKPVVLGKMNVDEQTETAMQYSIMSIPTIIVFKNGQIAHQVSGVQSKEKLLELLGM